MNSAPSVVGASDGLAAFRSIIAKRGPALAWARGAALRFSSWSLPRIAIVSCGITCYVAELPLLGRGVRRCVDGYRARFASTCVQGKSELRAAF